MDGDFESKLTDEHRELIGRRSEPVAWVIDVNDVRRLRSLMQDQDPRWAEGTGVAPPYVLGIPGAARSESAAPAILPNTILTQTEWRVLRPLRIGEPYQAVSQIVDIRERLGGRYGYSVLITSVTEVFDAEGNQAAATQSMWTQFDPASLGDRS
jgi:hypothetical protein